ncbi:hypothetical protein CAC42_5378 [Sphaceloma murrayae]|uniref:Uncharacterized protein n=1 Tax=Sphaceloma murrayae TaxID=2082308 RepID=A0A2K1QUZ9_9PEZI|nr:hypothetical protein CAC42_5378 [Sphaceloma murrayae]
MLHDIASKEQTAVHTRQLKTYSRKAIVRPVKSSSSQFAHSGTQVARPHSPSFRHARRVRGRQEPRLPVDELILVPLHEELPLPSPLDSSTPGATHSPQHGTRDGDLKGQRWATELPVSRRRYDYRAAIFGPQFTRTRNTARHISSGRHDGFTLTELKIKSKPSPIRLIINHQSLRKTPKRARIAFSQQLPLVTGPLPNVTFGALACDRHTTHQQSMLAAQPTEKNKVHGSGGEGSLRRVYGAFEHDLSDDSDSYLEQMEVEQGTQRDRTGTTHAEPPIASIQQRSDGKIEELTDTERMELRPSQSPTKFDYAHHLRPSCSLSSRKRTLLVSTEQWQKRKKKRTVDLVNMGLASSEKPDGVALTSQPDLSLSAMLDRTQPSLIARKLGRAKDSFLAEMRVRQSNLLSQSSDNISSQDYNDPCAKFESRDDTNTPSGADEDGEVICRPSRKGVANSPDQIIKDTKATLPNSKRAMSVIEHQYIRDLGYPDSGREVRHRYLYSSSNDADDEQNRSSIQVSDFPQSLRPGQFTMLPPGRHSKGPRRALPKSDKTARPRKLFNNAGKARSSKDDSSEQNGHFQDLPAIPEVEVEDIEYDHFPEEQERAMTVAKSRSAVSVVDDVPHYTERVALSRLDHTNARAQKVQPQTLEKRSQAPQKGDQFLLKRRLSPKLPEAAMQTTDPRDGIAREKTWSRILRPRQQIHVSRELIRCPHDAQSHGQRQPPPSTQSTIILDSDPPPVVEPPVKAHERLCPTGPSPPSNPTRLTSNDTAPVSNRHELYNEQDIGASRPRLSNAIKRTASTTLTRAPADHCGMTARDSLSIDDPKDSSGFAGDGGVHGLWSWYGDASWS